MGSCSILSWHNPRPTILHTRQRGALADDLGVVESIGLQEVFRLPIGVDQDPWCGPRVTCLCWPGCWAAGFAIALCRWGSCKVKGHRSFFQSPFKSIIWRYNDSTLGFFLHWISLDVFLSCRPHIRDAFRSWLPSATRASSHGKIKRRRFLPAEPQKHQKRLHQLSSSQESLSGASLDHLINEHMHVSLKHYPRF